jgi:hypothetical protein
MIPSPRLRRRPYVILLAAVPALLGVLLVGAPAQAVDVTARTALPVVAGTRLTFEGQHTGPAQVPDRDCTAGAVVRLTGLLNNLTPYQRAVRFVVTAEHCASLHENVRVGRAEVGYVYWVSHESDLALVRIEPTATPRRHCSPGSHGEVCRIENDYAPNALGKVLRAINLRGRELALSATGVGTPEPGEVFGSSGSSSGLKYTLRSIPVPPGVQRGRHKVTADTGSPLSTPGDSGGPIFSRRGVIYGIHSGHLVATPNIITYTPIQQFFVEEPLFALVQD